MKYRILALLLITIVINFFGSCRKNLRLVPLSAISSENFWKTPEQVETFVSGIMSRFRSSALNFELLGEMRSDVFGLETGQTVSFTGNGVGEYPFLWNNTLTPTRYIVAGFGNFYSNINQINILIDQLQSTDILTLERKKHYLGLGYGMRAFYYFQMLRSWGNCIIQTEPNESFDFTNLGKAATNADDVMLFIKDDIALSEENYDNDFKFLNKNRSFWSLPATLMLKAEVYLWTSHKGGGSADAQVALSALDAIQQNVSDLRLLTSFESIFDSKNKNNEEIIFSIRFKLNEENLPFNSQFVMPDNRTLLYYDSLENRPFDLIKDNWGASTLGVPVKIESFRRFNDLDQRKWSSIQSCYFYENGQYKLQGCFMRKYPGEQNAGVRHLTNDYPIYRYSELLLLKAEAKLILGQNPENEMNLVRKRAFGNNYDALVMGYPNQDVDKLADPFESILSERFLELMFEGKRWYDLRRMGDDYVFKYTTLKPSESYRLLWPIDLNTLSNNPELKQNTGYPSF